MSRHTHYILQTWSDLFIRRSDTLGYIEGFGSDNAACLSLSEARRLYREYGEQDRDARRFPRIIKVTVETKTITPPAKRRGRKSDFVV